MSLVRLRVALCACQTSFNLLFQLCAPNRQWVLLPPLEQVQYTHRLAGSEED